MSGSVKLNQIVTDLAIARSAVRKTDADPRIGWAWRQPDYRASEARAFPGPEGAITIEDAGMPALESAVDALLRKQHVRQVWLDDDVWTVVLSLLAAASVGDGIDLTTAVGRVVNPRPVRTVAALANVTWSSKPEALGKLALGQLSNEADAAGLASMLELDERASEALVSHTRQLLREFGPYVVATSTSTRQGQLAYEDFDRTIDDLVGLTLMLSTQLDDRGIYSLRGGTNRPGVRGVSLDRGALGELLARKGAGELGARVLVISEWGANNSFRWCSADPLPLDALLTSELHPVVTDLLQARDAIALRLRVAARWYARAFWADAEDDAALALGVALDSMLTGTDAVPGAVSKGRFALLERDPFARASRLARFDQVYRVRSAVAHGGEAKHSLDKVGGARSIFSDARWVAAQLLELRKISAPRTDAEHRELWESLQWGTMSWARPPEASVVPTEPSAHTRE